MLTACEIASMADTLAESYPDLGVLTRATKTSDGKGGKTAVWATVDAALPCEVQAVETRTSSSAEQPAAGRIESAAEFVIRVPAGTDIREVDRLTVLSSTFEITTVQGPESDELERRCNAVEVR